MVHTFTRTAKSDAARISFFTKPHSAVHFVGFTRAAIGDCRCGLGLGLGLGLGGGIKLKLDLELRVVFWSLEGREVEERWRKTTLGKRDGLGGGDSDVGIFGQRV